MRNLSPEIYFLTVIHALETDHEVALACADLGLDVADYVSQDALDHAVDLDVDLISASAVDPVAYMESDLYESLDDDHYACERFDLR